MGNPTAARRKYLYRVMEQQGDAWALVRHYQSSRAARHAARVRATTHHGVTYRIERSDPVTFDPAPAVYTLASYMDGVIL